ncbi:choice-of-anchor J domain-containing protein [Cryomorphaceae bacterium 1068]|nr:choice-of-anchor J domain-containing protein [Cryomorphaceae bacterium 1068]
MPKSTLLITLFSLLSINLFSQCLEWTNPTSEAGYSVFTSVPCNGDTLTTNSFEVWQSDAYEIPNLEAGGTYEFYHCDGAGEWTPEYTVFAPSGAIDAFGVGTGCSISWTASESGTYLIAINELDSCGIAGSTNNGFPTLITLSGGEDCTEPPIFIEGSESFEADTLPGCWISYNEDDDIFSWFIDNATVEAFDGEQYMRSSSFVPGIGAITPDNYLVSSPRVISEGDSLYYVVSAFSEFFPNEFYSIEIAINGNQPEDFIEIFSETLSSTNWEGRFIDMSDYAGEIVYVAFRHHNSTDQSGLLIDAVALPGEELENCAEVLSSDSDFEKLTFGLYPNPANDKVILSNLNESGDYLIRTFNVSGKLVVSEQVRLVQNSSYQMDVNHLLPGVYTIQILGRDAVGSQKLVIQ